MENRILHSDFNQGWLNLHVFKVFVTFNIRIFFPYGTFIKYIHCMFWCLKFWETIEWSLSFSKIYLCLKANSFYLTLKMTAMPKKNANFWIPNIFTWAIAFRGSWQFPTKRGFYKGLVGAPLPTMRWADLGMGDMDGEWKIRLEWWI